MCALPASDRATQLRQRKESIQNRASVLYHRVCGPVGLWNKQTTLTPSSHLKQLAEEHIVHSGCNLPHIRHSFRLLAHMHDPRALAVYQEGTVRCENWRRRAQGWAVGPAERRTIMRAEEDGNEGAVAWRRRTHLEVRRRPVDDDAGGARRA